MFSRDDLKAHWSVFGSDSYQLMDRGESDPSKHVVAGHAVYFVRTDDLLLDEHPLRAHLLMVLRHDGSFGFPGGIVEDGESIVDAVNRETVEEIGTALGVGDENFLCCHLYNHPKYGPIELHAFAKEISLDAFLAAEKTAVTAEHFGVETFGITRVPLFFRHGHKGLQTFLTNAFSGNAKLQLLIALYSRSLVTIDELQVALGLSRTDSH